MISVRQLIIAAFVVGALFSCSSGQIAPVTRTPLPCDVDAVFQKSCRTCHQSPPLFGAPMPLTTWEDVQAAAKSDPTRKVLSLIGQRIHDDAQPMPQRPNARLGTTESATLDAWIAAGAPADDGRTCAPADAGPDVPVVPSCNHDTHIAATAPFTMPTNAPDLYACYGFDVTGDQRYAIEIAPRIDNPKIVHHVLLFKAPNGSKYGTTATKCPAFGDVGWSIQYGWAPGGTALTLPPEASIKLDASTHYVVQIHYNNINGLVGQTDTSGVDLCTTPTPRANEADVIAFGAYQFPDIPAHGTMDWTCDYSVNSMLANTHLIATWGHMHKLGTTITTTQIPFMGTPSILIDVPKFDFNGQQWVPMTNTFTAGDVIRTRCVWNNQTNLPVSFGENTEQEMCFGFAMYYPKRNFVTWAQPSVQASCGVTK